MKKILIISLLFLLPNLFYPQLRKSIHIKTLIYEIMYSEVLEQPLWVKYTVFCSSGSVSREGMDFYLNDTIKTSDNEDYKNNSYDKGHMAPAGDFSCDINLLHQTFSYLNCSLQNQELNRTTWRFLESYERELSKKYKVDILIKCVFSKKSIKVTGGATVPDGYYKIIKYGDKTEKYYFKNEKPRTSDFRKFLVK